MIYYTEWCKIYRVEDSKIKVVSAKLLEPDTQRESDFAPRLHSTLEMEGK